MQLGNVPTGDNVPAELNVPFPWTAKYTQRDTTEYMQKRTRHTMYMKKL